MPPLLELRRRDPWMTAGIPDRFTDAETLIEADGISLARRSRDGRQGTIAKQDYEKLLVKLEGILKE